MRTGSRAEMVVPVTCSVRPGAPATTSWTPVAKFVLDSTAIPHHELTVGCDTTCARDSSPFSPNHPEFD
jgi:hypothetical protein